MGAFLSHSSAMNEDKGERKQAQHQRVFLRLGDNLAVDDDAHRANAIPRKKGSVRPVVKGSHKKIANGFAD